MLDFKSIMIPMYNLGEEEVNIFVINRKRYRYSSILGYRKIDSLYCLDCSPKCELCSEFERKIRKLHIKGGKKGSAIRMEIAVLANIPLTQ